MFRDKLEKKNSLRATHKNNDEIEEEVQSH
jgi:hypothetical protein